MGKLRVKPFTLFLCIILVLFIILGPRLIWRGLKNQEPLKSLYLKLPKWTGIITIWDVPYVECGTGSNRKWLNSCIRDFEKKYPGVFIQVRGMAPEMARMYFQGNNQQEFMPDIVSLGSYQQIVPLNMLQDLSPFFSKKEIQTLHPLAQKSIIKGNKMIGVPWMLGAYGLFINQDMLEEKELILPEDRPLDYSTLEEIVKNLTYQTKKSKKTKDYYGFCSYSSTYSRPLLGMIYQGRGRIPNEEAYNAMKKWRYELNAIPKLDGEISFENAWKLFGIEERVGVMLGSTRVLYQVRKRQDSGKGPNILVAAIPESIDKKIFQDQVGIYGLIKQQNKEKSKLCILFLKGLIGDNAQKNLDLIGSFPVRNDLDEIYQDDPEMNILEKGLEHYFYYPDDIWVSEYEAEYNDIIKKILQ